MKPAEVPTLIDLEGLHVPTISLSDQEAGLLREWLEAKLVELRREESHTDSPRFRGALYEVDAALTRLLEQLGTPTNQA